MYLLEHKPIKSDDLSSKGYRHPATVTAQNLMTAVYPEPAWIVPGLIPPGLTLFASRPKLGKSWLCLGMGLGVAHGETVLAQIPVDARPVLYIAMEDTLRRLQARLGLLLQGAPPPSNLHFATRWGRLDTTGQQELHQWMKEFPEAGLIIIDTLARIRGSGSGPNYANDYAVIAQLKTIADEYGIGIVVVHHLRKAEAADPMDMISGSSGLTGAADNVAVLKRERSRAEATLFVSGREVEEQELALKFEAAKGSWAIMGSAEECRLTQERQEIVDLLRKESCIMKLGDIASALGKKKPNVINLLNSLMELGLVEKAGYGKYKAGGESGESPPAPSGKEEASGPDIPAVSASLSETGESSEPAHIH